jgi:hypothetical protein
MWVGTVCVHPVGNLPTKRVVVRQEISRNAMSTGPLCGPSCSGRGSDRRIWISAS